MPKPGQLPAYPEAPSESSNSSPSGSHPAREPSGSHSGPVNAPAPAVPFSPSIHQVGEIVGGRYRLNRMLGHGALTETWEATHIDLLRSFAIKFLRQLAAGIGERMVEEARAVARIHHPNVVEYSDFGRVTMGIGGAAAGDPYFVTELLTGQTVEQMIHRRGTVAWSRAVNIAQQVCSALAAAHQQGIVHRDLRPGNVFLVETGQPGDFVKVVDFGLARGTTVGGTPAYMSPEQCRNEPLDPRSDVYALGCLIYTMITGEPPFIGDPDTLRWRQISEAPKPLRERAPRQFIPDELEAIVARCLDKTPSRRYADTRELAAELATLANFAAAASVAGGVVQDPSGSGVRPMGFAGRPAPRTPEELTNSYKPVNQPIVDDDDPDEALAAARPQARPPAPAPVVGLTVPAVVGIVFASMFVAAVAGLGVWWLVTQIIREDPPAAEQRASEPAPAEKTGDASSTKAEPQPPADAPSPRLGPTPKIMPAPGSEPISLEPAPAPKVSPKSAKSSEEAAAPEPQPQPQPQPQPPPPAPEKKKPSTKPDSAANQGIDHEELLDPWN
jgi:serine/threonine protein kinase